MSDVSVIVPADLGELERFGPERWPPEVLIEVPHGATRTAEFRAMEARLRGPFPADLVDFFHVNTDAGAPELARALAGRLGEADRAVAVLRCRIPRTFIDVNRVLGASAAAYRAAGVTPGVPPWVRDPEDHALLIGLHGAYEAASSALAVEVCGAGGRLLNLHTYAPRSVDVEVDDHIVARLRAAYAAEVWETWPERPEVDLIVLGPDGVLRAEAALVEAVEAALAAVGLHTARSATYPLHPSTTAGARAEAWPGRVLCLEVRRDLLAEPFAPFAEMRIGPARVERLAGALAGAILA